MDTDSRIRYYVFPVLRLRCFGCGGRAPDRRPVRRVGSGDPGGDPPERRPGRGPGHPTVTHAIGAGHGVAARLLDCWHLGLHPGCFGVRTGLL